MVHVKMWWFDTDDYFYIILSSIISKTIIFCSRFLRYLYMEIEKIKIKIVPYIRKCQNRAVCKRFLNWINPPYNNNLWKACLSSFRKLIGILFSYIYFFTAKCNTIFLFTQYDTNTCYTLNSKIMFFSFIKNSTRF